MRLFFILLITMAQLCAFEATATPQSMLNQAKKKVATTKPKTTTPAANAPAPSRSVSSVKKSTEKKTSSHKSATYGTPVVEEREKEVKASDYGTDINVEVAKPEVEVKEEAPKTSKSDSPISMSMVEQRPVFPGGESAMYAWLSNNICYPEAAAEDGVQGRVTVSFIVEKDGRVTNVKVLRGKHPDLDAEAVRVVKKMPKWTPGRNNGEPVPVTYVLPVTFGLR